MEKAEVAKRMGKIIDFARAIVLDRESQSAGSIAATMAQEIENYASEVYEDFCKQDLS